MQEKIGLIPRSILRTLDRFRKQLFPNQETKTITLQEFQVSRQQMQVSVITFLTLVLVPLGVNICGKTFFVKPFTQFLWNNYQTELFLNQFQAQRAFSEMQEIEDVLFFDSLIQNQINYFSCSETSNDSLTSQPSDCSSKNVLATLTNPILPDPSSYSQKEANNKNEFGLINPIIIKDSDNLLITNYTHGLGGEAPSQIEKYQLMNLPKSMSEGAKPPSQNNILLRNQNLQEKLLALAIQYNEESIDAISNLIGDALTCITITFLFFALKVQILILQSFLTESFYSLSNANRSLIIIIVTDLLVGYHSPQGWKLLTQLILQHYGFPETKLFILCFIGTFPVILDTIFKYWIFRHLNRISPTTVLTYHRMIE